MARHRIPPAGPAAAWVEGVGVDAGLVRDVAEAVAAHGVAVRPREASGPAHGVVVFARPTPELADAVSGGSVGASVGAGGRVLALATAPLPHPEDAWRLLRTGAADVLTWPDGAAGEALAARLRRWHRVDELTSCRYVRETLVGEDPTWRAVLREVAEVAHFTDAPVLVTGESGTGKEGVARLVHELDPRAERGQLVVLDCSTVVPSLAGSEFFGHEKGAFTGASAAREGAFELADGGTLFLDEVGELPSHLQAELLRVVQEGTYKRVGSNVWRTSRFRLVCATHRDLTAELARGDFRDDFYHRIAGCTLRLPPLRERRGDVVPLFAHFYRQAHPDRDVPALDPAVRAYLVTREYPGNVRDLRNLVQRLAHRHVGCGPVTVGDVPEDERPEPRGAALEVVGPAPNEASAAHRARAREGVAAQP